MLILGGVPFSSGRATFTDKLPTATGSARVYVKVAVGGMDDTFLAMLDSGAEWSVIDPEIAEASGLTAQDGEATTLRYQGGRAPGKLVHATISVIADEGESLNIEGTVFVPTGEWPTGRHFLGYHGFLENIRIGLAPQTNDLYFGV